MKMTIGIRGPIMEYKKRVRIFVVLQMVSLLLEQYKLYLLPVKLIACFTTISLFCRDHVLVLQRKRCFR